MSDLPEIIDRGEELMRRRNEILDHDAQGDTSEIDAELAQVIAARRDAVKGSVGRITAGGSVISEVEDRAMRDAGQNSNEGPYRGGQR